MIIKDVDGGRLSLTKTKLLEIDHNSAYPFHALLKDVLASYREGQETRLKIYGKDGAGVEWSGGYPSYIMPNRIGCRTFSPATFAKILKAAGVKPVRKTNKRKVAR